MEWVKNSPTPSLDGFDPREDERIRQVVAIFVRQHPAIPGYDKDDLYQEGRVAWLRARKHYRADRGTSISTYPSRVVENRLRDLGRRARAARRYSPRGLASLDMQIGEGGDTQADLLRDDAPDPAAEAERTDMADQIDRVRRRLPLRRRDVLDALADDLPKAQIARDLGISRDTLYEEIHRIRDACRDAGLEEFLR